MEVSNEDSGRNDVHRGEGKGDKDQRVVLVDEGSHVRELQ